MRWYTRMGRRVWIHEIIGFFFTDQAKAADTSVAAFLGAAQDHEEEAMAV